ncbi:UPF0738 family protein [Salibacterium aidingense]|uniref:UPF0738 family protein n=1 Tax=Salibacterium aidingense TaxID=384933 RepID=UPI003BC96F1B
MEHILTVTETKVKYQTLYLIPIEDWPEKEWATLEDGGRMLADSDALAFVYTLESPESFVQLRMPKSIWPALKEAYEQELGVCVKGPDVLDLPLFPAELAFILDNVPGNGNYGSSMVEAVEEAFQLT